MRSFRLIGVLAAACLLLLGCEAERQQAVEPVPLASPQVTGSALTPEEPSVVILAAPPTWIQLPGQARAQLNPQGACELPDGTVDPCDDRPAWSTRSFEPGTDAQGATFIFGHNYAAGQTPFAALDGVRPGDVVLVGTPNGVLRYAVGQTMLVPKHQLASRNDIFVSLPGGLEAEVPGRLVLITCGVAGGEDTYNNRVVIAQLRM